MTFRLICCALLSVVVSMNAWAGGMPQGASFSYQGMFKQSGAPASGTYHLRFQLFDSPTGGAQVGADFDVPTLAINAGQFTVDLNFGVLAFDGSARWLQVKVITDGGNTVTTLVPRQSVAPSPYALFALSADGPNLTNLNASNLVSGTVPNAQLSGTYGSPLELSNPSNTVAGVFTGSGAGVTNLNATNVSSGTLSTARLPSGGDWPLSSTLNLDVNTLAIDAVNNRVGIGTPTPTGPLHVRTTGPFMVLQDNASAANQAGYVAFWNNAFTETAWVGFGSPGDPNFSIVNARSGGDIILSAFSGSVGIGTSSPTQPLHVEGGSLAAARFGRTGDGNLVFLGRNGLIEGTIAVTGGTVSYNAFTGSHYGWSDRAIERGTVVVMTGENRRRTDDPGAEPIYGIETSILPNDPRCLGAYLGLLEPSWPPSLENPHQIMAVGNGDMWVVESAGGRSIEPGDYLISSDVEGHAMLDDLQRFPIGHVIARAAEAVSWEGATESVAGRKHRRISVFFETFVRAEAYPEAKALRADMEVEIESLRAGNAALQNRIQALEQLLMKQVQSQQHIQVAH